MDCKGQVMSVFEARLCRWLQGDLPCESDMKVSHTMVKALNDLILVNDSAAEVFAELPKSSLAVHKAPSKRVARPTHFATSANSRKRRYASVQSEAHTLSKRYRQSSSTSSLFESIQQISEALTKWQPLLTKCGKGGLATDVVCLASHLATTIASFPEQELMAEFHSNASPLCVVAAAIHKMVQLAASIDDVSARSSPYFARLSGGSGVHVTEACYVAILVSVNLLRLVWPQGISSSHWLGDVPVPPTLDLTGRLYDHLRRSSVFGESCVELHQRLSGQNGVNGDSSILRCTRSSLEAMLPLLSRQPAVQKQCIGDSSMEPVRDSHITDDALPQVASSDTLDDEDSVLIACQAKAHTCQEVSDDEDDTLVASLHDNDEETMIASLL
jgi:hypothetical protein